MRVAESFLAAKKAAPYQCEDALVTASGFAAVIDGVTAKGRMLWHGGKTSGRIAAETLSRVIRGLAQDATMADFIAAASKAICAEYSEAGRMQVAMDEPAERISACVAVYSDFRKEVWIVGDCQCLLDGKLYSNPKYIDKCLAQVRADVDAYMLQHGATLQELREKDVGREMIAKFLRLQTCFQNRSGADKFGYCAIDGFPMVGEEDMVVCALDSSLCADADASYPWQRPMCIDVSGCRSIVLATDGYPRLFPTLAESEEYLHRVLASDPLCIGENVQTKGLLQGQNSYDDRAYIRIKA